MDVYVLLIVVFSIAFTAPVARWFYINYLILLIRAVAVKLKGKFVARKSKFQQELDKIADQYGVPSTAMDFQGQT